MKLCNTFNTNTCLTMIISYYIIPAIPEFAPMYVCEYEYHYYYDDICCYGNRIATQLFITRSLTIEQRVRALLLANATFQFGCDFNGCLGTYART